jgi:gas vesicle protein
MINNKVFWGIVTAAAAGAVIGLLFAPDQGMKTRKKIKNRSNDWAQDVLDTLERSKHKVIEVAGKVKKNSVDAKEEILEKASGK